MYLTGGQYKGRKIEVPDTAKPTLSKVRESVFNMLQGFEFKYKTFIDMCSGSGIMGLEALSRGYIVTALEINPKAYKTIQNTYSKIGLKGDIINCDCLKYKSEKHYEIIYLDPVWADNYDKFILKAYELAEELGIIILEYDDKKPVEVENIIKSNNLNLKIVKAKKYGRCRICFLQKNNVNIS